MLWACMVLSSVVVACGFVYMQTSEFTKATVVTTVDTTTAPLSDVYFPSVTICNINQVWRSLNSLFFVTVDSAKESPRPNVMKHFTSVINEIS
jgi:Amiloride-sensitive sodium channel